MNRITLGTVLLALMAPISFASSDSTSRSPLRTVESVDVARYGGRWYEIARYPNRFERACHSDSAALYTLRKDGKVQVVNSCRKKNGKTKTVRGTAKVADKQSNAKLRVTFLWPIYGDYWIVGLSSDYRYAIIGEPRRRYLWILSRTPDMDSGTYQEVLQQIRAAGYDPDKLVKTPQSPPGPGAAAE